MKILVVGVGSIARRHIKNLKTIDKDFSIAVLRQHSKDSDLGAITPLVEQVFFEEKDALQWKPEVVFITNPSPFHISAALTFAKAGCHLFVEKPLSDTLDEVEELQEVVQKAKLVVMVGYVMRFSQTFKIIKKAINEGMIGEIRAIRAMVGRYLPAWRPDSDYRKDVTSRKELGGGVVAELSHELDYIRWMCGEVNEVSAVLGQVSDFEIDVEDIAEINVRFENGAIGNVHLDMIDHGGNRSCRIIGSKGTIVWDSSDGQSIKLLNTDGEQNLWDPKGFDYNQMFIDEIKIFFECIKANKNSPIDIVEGKKALELVLAAKRSALERCVITL